MSFLAFQSFFRKNSILSILLIILFIILCYILFKKIISTVDNFESTYSTYIDDIKFIIIIPTFHRNNNKTEMYLTRSLNSILNQKYTNWDILIAGDKYEPETELLTIIDTFRNKTKNNIFYIKNENVERDYVKNKQNLWYCAGATSLNLGLKFAREHNYKYYCHLDDDDYWTNDHLILLANTYNKYKNCVFANTQSTYINGSFLPQEIIEVYENNRLPLPNQTIHSSFSFRIDIIPYYYDTSLTENGIDSPSDALMLSKLSNFINSNKSYCSIYIPELTCYHDYEGETKVDV